jgi:hypothetical protein
MLPFHWTHTAAVLNTGRLKTLVRRAPPGSASKQRNPARDSHFRFITGLLIGLPVSLALWALIIWAIFF